MLLIHGYLATKGSLHLLEEHLARRGHVVMSFRFGPINLGDIRDSAGLVARKVESIVAQTGVEHVDIVGHSMGGLVGLYYVKRLGGRHRVRRLVLMGTPTQGTWSALFGLVTAPLGLASLQLLPGSPFLRSSPRRRCRRASTSSRSAPCATGSRPSRARRSRASVTSRCPRATRACSSTRRSPTSSTGSSASPTQLRTPPATRMLTARHTQLKMSKF